MAALSKVLRGAELVTTTFAGGAVLEHREFQFHPARDAAIAHGGREFWRDVFDALQRVLADWRAALRGLLARCRHVGGCGGERIAAESDGARFIQPGFGRGQIVARHGATNLVEKGVAQTLARGSHCRTAAVGADQREQIGLGVVIGGLHQAVRSQCGRERLRERIHPGGARADQRVLQRAPDGGHFLARRADAVGIRQPALGVGGVARGSRRSPRGREAASAAGARFPATPASSGMIWRAAST